MQSGCLWSQDVFFTLKFTKFNASTDLYFFIHKFVL